MVLSGCHTDVIKEPRPVDVVLGKIEGTWKFSAAVLGGVSVSDFRNTTIAFSGGDSDDLIHFIFANMPQTSPWPEAGTFKLGNDINSELILESNGDTVVYAIGDSSIEMTTPFHKPATPPGEIILPIEYSWVFTFEK